MAPKSFNECREKFLGGRGCCTAQCRTSLLLVATIAIQVFYAIRVYKATKTISYEWRAEVEEDCEVLVARKPQFWGPVHLLVPPKCKEVRKWNHVLEKENKKYNQTIKNQTTKSSSVEETSVRRQQQVRAKDSKSEKKSGKKAETEDSKSEKKSGKKAETEDSKSEKKNEEKAETERRLVFREPRELEIVNPFHPKVVGCFNGTKKTEKTFDGPDVANRYFSMISLSAIVSGRTDMTKLRKSRANNQNYLMWVLIVTFILKYGLKINDIFSFMCSHKYVQLWNGGRTRIDKLLESMMIHGLSIVFTLSMQLTMCTNFLTFWNDEGYFTMSYIPGIGFVIFFCSFVFFTAFIIIDRIGQWMVRNGNLYIWCFWIVWLVWMCLVTVPMIGYCIYVIQFVYEIKVGHMIREEPFSPEFVEESQKVCNAALWLTGVAILELILILKLDWEEATSRQRGQ